MIKRMNHGSVDTALGGRRPFVEQNSHKSTHQKSPSSQQQQQQQQVTVPLSTVKEIPSTPSSSSTTDQHFPIKSVEKPQKGHSFPTRKNNHDNDERSEIVSEPSKSNITSTTKTTAVSDVDRYSSIHNPSAADVTDILSNDPLWSSSDERNILEDDVFTDYDDQYTNTGESNNNSDTDDDDDGGDNSNEAVSQISSYSTTEPAHVALKIAYPGRGRRQWQQRQQQQQKRQYQRNDSVEDKSEQYLEKHRGPRGYQSHPSAQNNRNIDDITSISFSNSTIHTSVDKDDSHNHDIDIEYSTSTEHIIGEDKQQKENSHNNSDTFDEQDSMIDHSESSDENRRALDHNLNRVDGRDHDDDDDDVDDDDDIENHATSVSDSDSLDSDMYEKNDPTDTSLDEIGYNNDDDDDGEEKEYGDPDSQSDSQMSHTLDSEIGSDREDSINRYDIKGVTDVDQDDSVFDFTDYSDINATAADRNREIQRKEVVEEYDSGSVSDDDGGDTLDHNSDDNDSQYDAYPHQHECLRTPGNWHTCYKKSCRH
jgi:hypothetical protein